MAFPTFQGATGGSISSAGLAAQPWVSPHQTDDIGLCICGSADNTTGTHTTPSGFTLTSSNPSGWSTGTSGTAVQVETAYKRATSASEASAGFTGDIGTQYCKHLLIRGCKTSGSPMNVEASGVLGTAATSLSIVTGLTTTANECLIVLVLALDADTGAPDTSFISANTNGNLSNIVKQNTNQWSTGSGLGLHIFTGELSSAGAVGTWSITCGSNSTAAWWCGAMEPVASAVTLRGRRSLLGVGL